LKAFAFEQSAQALPRDGVVVPQQYTDGHFTPPTEW
jgi:hypothetical protein